MNLCVPLRKYSLAMVLVSAFWSADAVGEEASISFGVSAPGAASIVLQKQSGVGSKTLDRNQTLQNFAGNLTVRYNDEDGWFDNEWEMALHSELPTITMPLRLPVADKDNDAARGTITLVLDAKPLADCLNDEVATLEVHSANIQVNFDIFLKAKWLYESSQCYSVSKTRVANDFFNASVWLAKNVSFIRLDPEAVAAFGPNDPHVRANITEVAVQELVFLHEQELYYSGIKQPSNALKIHDALEAQLVSDPILRRKFAERITPAVFAREAADFKKMIAESK